MNFALPYVGILAGAATAAFLILAGAPLLLALIAYPVSGLTAILLVAIVQFNRAKRSDTDIAAQKPALKGSERYSLYLVAGFRRH